MLRRIALPLPAAGAGAEGALLDHRRLALGSSQPLLRRFLEQNVTWVAGSAPPRGVRAEVL